MAVFVAIDSSRLTLDVWLRKKHDNQAAYSFFKWLVSQFGKARILVTDKAPSLACAFKKLKTAGFFEKSVH